jgi:hypothetical protein
MRTIGNRVRVTPPRVRIPPSPPVHALRRRWPATCGVLFCRFESHAATTATIPTPGMLVAAGRQQPDAGRTPADRYTIHRMRQPRKASCNRIHRHGCTRTRLAPPPTVPFCRTRQGSDQRQSSAWGMHHAAPHTPSGLGKPSSRTATHHTRVPEARLFYRSALPRNEALAQLQNSQLSEQKTGFH